MDSTRSDESRACPTCSDELPAQRPEAFPFCTERCRLIDLGRWLDEDYRLSENIS